MIDTILTFLPMLALFGIGYFIYRRSRSNQREIGNTGVSFGALVGWAAVAFVFLLPFNWFRLAFIGEMSAQTPLWQLLLATLIAWSLAALGTFLLLRSRKARIADRLADETQMRTLLAAPLKEIQPSQALLKPGEKAYAAVPGDLRKVQTVGYAGGNAGVSVRVAKGFTLRSGTMRGHAVKDVVTIASGELVITNTRLIFAGDTTSFVIPLGKLLNTTDYSDGFGFHDGRSSYVIATRSGRDRIVFAIALKKVLRGFAAQSD